MGSLRELELGERALRVSIVVAKSFAKTEVDQRTVIVTFEIRPSMNSVPGLSFNFSSSISPVSAGKSSRSVIGPSPAYHRNGSVSGAATNYRSDDNSGRQQEEDLEADEGSDGKQKKQKFTRSRTACLQVTQTAVPTPTVLADIRNFIVPITEVEVRCSPSEPMSQLYRSAPHLPLASRRRSVI